MSKTMPLNRRIPMSILKPPKLVSLMRSNKWKIWRIINAVVIILSFFAPWLVMDWGGVQRDFSHAFIMTGFQTLDWYKRLGIALLTDSGLPSRIGEGVLIDYFLGLAAIILYCVLNTLLAMYRTKVVDKPIWIISVLCLIILGMRSLWYVGALDSGWQALSITLWGYWLVLIGLVSSIVLEVSYVLLKRA